MEFITQIFTTPYNYIVSLIKLIFKFRKGSLVALLYLVAIIEILYHYTKHWTDRFNSEGVDFNAKVKSPVTTILSATNPNSIPADNTNTDSYVKQLANSMMQPFKIWLEEFKLDMQLGLGKLLTNLRFWGFLMVIILFANLMGNIRKGGKAIFGKK